MLNCFNEEAYVGGIYIIPLDIKDFDDFRSCIPNIAASLAHAVSKVRSFLYVFYCVKHSNSDNSFTSCGYQSIKLHLEIIYVLSCILATWMSSLDKALLHIEIYPVTFFSSHRFSQKQKCVLQDLILGVLNPVRSEFYERCAEGEQVILFQSFRHDSLHKEGKWENYRTKPNILWVKLMKEIQNSARAYPKARGLLPYFITPDSFVSKLKFPHFDFHSPYSSVVVAGTFDHLHLGHRFLLSAGALLCTQRLTISIVHDDSALLDQKQHKSVLLPLAFRAQQVHSFVLRFCSLIKKSVCVQVVDENITQNTFQNTVLDHLGLNDSMSVLKKFGDSHSNSIHPNRMRHVCCCEQTSFILNFFSYNSKRCSLSCLKGITLELLSLTDAIGAARNRSDFDCLLVTSDTQTRSLIVNHERQQNNLKPLDIVTLPLVEPLLSGKIEENKVLNKAYSIQQDVTEKSQSTTSYLVQSTLPSKTTVLLGMPPGELNSVSRLISSTHHRQYLVNGELIQMLRDSWKTISSVLMFSTSIEMVWGTRLLHHMRYSWRMKQRDFLLNHITLFWKAMDNKNTSDSVILQIAWSTVAVWFVSVALTVCPKSSTEENYFMTLEKLKKLLQLFCSDLFWFSKPSNTNNFHASCLWRSSSSAKTFATMFPEMNPFTLMSKNVVEFLKLENLENPKHTVEAAPFRNILCQSCRLNLSSPDELEYWRNVGWRGSFILLDLFFNLFHVAHHILKNSWFPETCNTALLDDTLQDLFYIPFELWCSLIESYTNNLADHEISELLARQTANSVSKCVTMWIRSHTLDLTTLVEHLKTVFC